MGPPCTGIYPPELRSTNLDFDWTYRRVVPAFGSVLARAGGRVWDAALRTSQTLLHGLLEGVIHRLHGSGGYFARTWTTGQIAFFVALMLGAYLILSFW